MEINRIPNHDAMLKFGRWLDDQLVAIGGMTQDTQGFYTGSYGAPYTKLVDICHQNGYVVASAVPSHTGTPDVIIMADLDKASQSALENILRHAIAAGIVPTLRTWAGEYQRDGVAPATSTLPLFRTLAPHLQGVDLNCNGAPDINDEAIFVGALLGQRLDRLPTATPEERKELVRELECLKALQTDYMEHRLKDYILPSVLAHTADEAKPFWQLTDIMLVPALDTILWQQGTPHLSFVPAAMRQRMPEDYARFGILPGANP